MKNVGPHWSFEVLLDYFKAQGGQEVLENQMLRDFFPEEDFFSQGVNLELFEKHFLLHRRLYLFDDELRLKTGQRLSIRLIRFKLVDAPAKGTCGWLDEEKGAYCGRSTGTDLCEEHTADPAALDVPGLKAYYMDWNNLNTMDEDRLQRLVNSFFHQVFHPEEKSLALETLGLSGTPTPGEIRARWIELTKEHHPDAGGELAVYQKINAAYQILKEGF